MKSRLYSKSKIFPLLFILPQVVITIIFFIWPALMALVESLQRGDAFGVIAKFDSYHHYLTIFNNPDYTHAFYVTVIFSIVVASLTLIIGFILAILVYHINRWQWFYKTMLIWPYAVAPAIAAVLFRFLFNPAIGIIPTVFNSLGYEMNYHLNGQLALFIVMLTAIWQQISYNFIFFLTGLQVIPRTLIEAASMDGASKFKQLLHIVIPLLSPTTFFLFIINLLYSFFDTFGIIHIITQGGPAGATTTLVYKVYNDGFIGLDVGGAAAQSVILMIVIMVITFFQFRFVERKVHYR